jgi:hypothetical protein
MGESLYTVLGVDRDADAQAIDRAFRDLAKSRHPDTNDDPDAGRQFKRLTVARETLVDADERASYDRLGHATYVRQRGLEGLFDVEPAATGEVSSDETDASVRADGYGDTDGDWWEARSAEPAHGTSATPTGGSGIYGGQTASEETTTKPTRGPVESLVGVVRTLGPWAALHCILLVSVSISAWFLLSGGAAMSASGPVAVVVGLIALASVSISALHVALRLYA